MIRFYDSYSKRKKVFKPVEEDYVKIYTCGPTVYWHQHIGNLRAYIFSDTLKRVILYAGHKVRHVINVTDVGHLTEDDFGEDKVEKRAKEEKKTVQEITNFYFSRFKNDLKKLKVIEPDFWLYATEHIREQIELIKKLEEKGYTYITGDGVYFDTSKFKYYGKLSNKKTGELIGGKRIKIGEKKNITDFALWKFSKPEEKRQQEWESPWGRGFPGWHIECSAMAIEYLGKRIDIHTGGEDHIHIHHENEIAQSEAALGVHPWVNFWMHVGFLLKEKEKMSKSKGRILTLSEVEKLGFSAMDFRFLNFLTHYRKQLHWSIEAIENAKTSLLRIKKIIENIKDDGRINREYLKEFEERIYDDLDMPGAVAVLWKLLRDEKANGKIKTIEKMDSVFGLGLLEKENIKIPDEVLELAKKRSELRKQKKWLEADEIREKIASLGWKIDDVGFDWKLEKLHKP
ncbi:cysteine--tRNA ligase [Candidatus Pacearchaeota archaeon]|nr:MAG: cysteine--tRNA ligase [Candidatus Pacearchaeota archaeon]